MHNDTRLPALSHSDMTMDMQLLDPDTPAGKYIHKLLGVGDEMSLCPVAAGAMAGVAPMTLLFL